MWMRLIRPLAIVLGLCGIFREVQDARAALLPKYPLRTLSAMADLIVVGEPLDSDLHRISRRYTVLEVVKGAGVVAGEEILIRDVNLPSNPGYVPTFPRNSADASHRFRKALLFLCYPEAEYATEGFALIFSGVRILDGSGNLFAPMQFSNPGGYDFYKEDKQTWDDVLQAVRADLTEIAGVRGFGLIEDRAVRNQAIFRWIALHKGEIAGFQHFRRYYPPEKSWGPLDDQVFDWIFESCLPDDCWRATLLEDELKIERLNDRHAPSFCSQAGRELLLKNALDESLPERVRLLAFSKLSKEIHYWSTEQHYRVGRYAPMVPLLSPISWEEQDLFLKRLSPLLRSPDAKYRAAAARVLRAACRPPSGSWRARTMQEAVWQLVELFRNDPDLQVRRAAAEAVNRIESDVSSTSLGQNPGQIAMLVRFLGERDGKLRFELILHSETKLTELPTFHLEKRAPRWSVVGERTIVPELESPRDLFSDGWTEGSAFVTVPAKSLTQGLWFLDAEGKVDSEKAHWSAERLVFTLPPPGE